MQRLPPPRLAPPVSERLDSADPSGGGGMVLGVSKSLRHCSGPGCSEEGPERPRPERLRLLRHGWEKQGHVQSQVS